MPFPQATSQTAELSCCGAGVVFLKFPMFALTGKVVSFPSFSHVQKEILFLAHFSPFELAFGH